VWRILALSVAAIATALSASAQETATKERRIRVLANGLYNPMGFDFTDHSTFTAFVEEGESRRTYEGGRGLVFEVGGIMDIRKGLGVMGSVEIYRSDFEATFEESLPHPFYFDRPREVSGTVTDLDYHETAVHADLVYTRVLPRWTLDLFLGPTFFFTNTEVLSSVNTASQYPFDEATVSSTSSTQLDDNPIGFNGGGAITWRWTELVGLAFQARYSRGSIGISREGGEEIDLDAGGLRLGGGLRLSF
jgi:hypothetical protein